MADDTASMEMTVDERETFLADVHVGILSVARKDKGPLALPIWYVYEDGVILIGTDGDSVKARLLRAAGRATVTAQTEAPPYKYVMVEGPVELVHNDRDPYPMAARYLGPEFGRWYVENSPPDQDSTLVRLTPERWITCDFNKGLGA